ncbi:MAG: dephospho-CoA kinase [Thermomicrobiales bacterium]|nr:dephospho-CoA kinase [Thermomicrobiales bacterium]
MSRPFVIGVTGPIASGKSAVTRRLADHGAVVLDADLVYRDLVKPGLPLTARIAERFGPGVLTDAGELDRKALGAIVFADPEALADLDRLTHPAIIAEIGARLEAIDAPLAVIEAVKLSRGTGKYCDETWLVQVDPARQLERLMTRNGLSRADAERRIAAQMTYDPAGYTRVLCNDGSLSDLAALVDTTLATALASQ